MHLQFIGVEPESGQTGSPTIWIHEETGDLTAQSHIADESTRAEYIEKNTPGHDEAIPAGETAIRIPAHMIPILKEAIDAVQRTAALR